MPVTSFWTLLNMTVKSVTLTVVTSNAHHMHFLLHIYVFTYMYAIIIYIADILYNIVR